MILETNNDLKMFIKEHQDFTTYMKNMSIAIDREEERNRMISQIDKLKDKLDLKNKEIKKLLQDKNAYINITNEALRELKDCVISQDSETARTVTERLFYGLTHLNSKYKNDTNTESYMEKVKMIDSLNNCIKIEHKRYKELKTLLEQKEDELHEKQLELYNKSDVITISNAIIKNQNDKIKSLQNIQKQDITYLNEEVKAKDKIIGKQVKIIEKYQAENNSLKRIINGLMSL